MVVAIWSDDWASSGAEVAAHDRRAIRPSAFDGILSSLTWQEGRNDARGISAGESDLTTRVHRATMLTALLLATSSSLAAQAEVPIYRNVASVLTGATLLEDDFGATFGVSYERRLGRWYGLGGYADFLTSTSRNVATGISFNLHPTRAIKAFVAPGVDFRSNGPDLVLLRMGAGYDFAIGPRWLLSPEVAIDFEGGYRVFVVGVELGWRF
jgi:hypothetical protein